MTEIHINGYKKPIKVINNGENCLVPIEKKYCGTNYAFIIYNLEVFEEILLVHYQDCNKWVEINGKFYIKLPIWLNISIPTNSINIWFIPISDKKSLKDTAHRILDEFSKETEWTTLQQLKSSLLNKEKINE